MSGSKARVLVVEDDGDIAEVLRRSLRLEGYEVRLAGDGVSALDESSLFEPDAVVLDLGLPKLDGVEVCRRLRAQGDVPILVLTARDALESRVEGLDSGADDYLVKPFEREYLMRNERLVVSRQALLDDVWGYHPFAETNTIDVFVSNLRRKLEADGEARVLHTVRGAGYVLRDS